VELADQRPIVDADGASPSLTVVVPTREEAGNVLEFVRRLERALPGDAEIVFVDDSQDETPEVILEAGRSAAIPIRLIHRAPEQQHDGLSGAVVEGLRVARARHVCVMDADLQHPPELLPQLLRRCVEEDLDLVVASRRCDGGGMDDFGPLRSLLSGISTLVARTLFPRRLRNVNDPMSGFFLLRRDAVKLERLRPHGFKILLELLLRNPGLRVGQVPFRFGTRYAGESKASLRQGLCYLRQLAGLRLGDDRVSRFARFGVVGTSGLVVNMLVLAALASIAGIHYLAAAIIATQASTTWNFLLTEGWVFSDRTGRSGVFRRAALFFVMNNAALLLRGPLLFLLVSVAGINYLVSNLVSLLALTLTRFAVADGWIWARPLSRHALYRYDIHGLATVESEVALPELAFFRVERASRPTISVRIGAVRGRVSTDPNRLRYREPFGFAIEIEAGERMRVTAAPLLARSPHVLYTNVIEPLLRWTFVERGYALVHGACIANESGLAYLVTARTDTGKTTTILRTLSHDSYGFLADDLTLVAPDGHVLAYPKPLTISSHTVGALVKTDLSRAERLRLVYQSRIHSRSGRRFAFLLTRYGLPVATINAVVQWLVPPPKYAITRLVQGVRIVQSAKLAGLLVISRSDDRVLSLQTDEALDVLLSNCADAYGFPPYSSIEGFLFGRSSVNLVRAEKEIIRSALEGLPAQLVESTSMNWWERLVTLMHALPTMVAEALEDAAPTAPAAADGGELMPKPASSA
jgi:dolichol-phosphate mannosyltransferase